MQIQKYADTKLSLANVRNYSYALILARRQFLAKRQVGSGWSIEVWTAARNDLIPRCVCQIRTYVNTTVSREHTHIYMITLASHLLTTLDPEDPTLRSLIGLSSQNFLHLYSLPSAQSIRLIRTTASRYSSQLIKIAVKYNYDLHF